MRFTVRPLGAIAIALLAACAGHARTAGVPDDSLLQRILVAEDARGTGAEGIAPLLEGEKSRDSTIRRVAVRALGRLQRPSLAPELTNAMNDSLSSIRAEAVNALAQSIQSLPRGKAATDSSRAALKRVRSALTARQAVEIDPTVIGAIASAAGRVPDDGHWAFYTIHDALARVQGVDWGESGIDYTFRTYHFERVPRAVAHGIIAGFYSLVLQRMYPVESEDRGAAIAIVNQATVFPDPWVRRLALLTMLHPIGIPSRTPADLMSDPDPQVRRIALSDFESNSAPDIAARMNSISDPEAMVRSERLRVGGIANNNCPRMYTAVRDSDLTVSLAAIDALWRCGREYYTDSVTLQAIAESLDPRALARASIHGAWQKPAHALISITKSSWSYQAAPILPVFLTHPEPLVREYAVRAAAAQRNILALLLASSDRDPNVRTEAITGLSRYTKNAYDSIYIAALSSPAYQVVLSAANALAGSKDARSLPALFAALDRLSAERRENSRDERIAILNRIAELGTPADAPRVSPYTTDFDSTVATKAATTLTKWTGAAVLARAKPLPIRPEPLAQIFRSRNLQLRITMAESSGGGTILVRLFTDEAPATISRIIRLARAHYYDGLTFHRVVPGFVIQGGSPGANEQVGDAAFMRDELGTRSHERGTLGISTRGRDTGDAQFFVNLVDNPRLDHDYTVFGEVISGMSVVDQILEGDVMARVEVIEGTFQK